MFDAEFAGCYHVTKNQGFATRPTVKTHSEPWF